MSEPANQRQLPAGKIEVAPRAIATIAADTVRTCYGVVGMAPRNLREGVAQVLRWQDAHKGVDVHVRGDAIVIDLYVIVAYGTRIAEVAKNVRESVHYAAERALGMPVAEVNVRIQGLQMQDQAS
ncbi:MAG: Asp23/Gls24 family envelope stress response protein [Roseiflexaceae bacterium]|nr:Asp23/Gls24 family envelope stress response protein [Roseiflexaceae bacterium]